MNALTTQSKRVIKPSIEKKKVVVVNPSSETSIVKSEPPKVLEESNVQEKGKSPNSIIKLLYPQRLKKE